MLYLLVKYFVRIFCQHFVICLNNFNVLTSKINFKMEDLHCELVDFGCVHWGIKFTRDLKIKNESTIDQVFVVQNYSEMPSLNSGFSVKPSKSPLIRPNEEFTFAVEFVSNFVNARCCDSFLIKHLFGDYCIVNSRAVVRGPTCSISCSQLQMACPSDQRKVCRQFSLKNEGQCETNFQFTVEGHPLISIQPNHGRIPASTSINVIITYTPVDKRKYFKRIFCLVANHEPLVLNLHATWLKSNENSVRKVENNYLPMYLNGYHCFFSDVMTCMMKEEIPIVTTDKKFLDFGHCQPKSSKQIEFTITNNSSHKITILWLQGLFTKEFRIQPIEEELSPNDCLTFSATFSPLVRDLLYGTVLEAQLLLGGTLMAVPLEISLKGDSFEELSCGWSAQYKVHPSSLVLPPCVPSPFCPSHATLVIHRRGHLPLAFCFHPPPATNFCVKPQQGVIREGFQIVVVQYQPKTLFEAIDTEEWLLTFNSNENVNQCFVKFGGSIETPYVILNRGNDIKFPSVHPGSKFTLQVDVYNPTRFSFWYHTEVVGMNEDVLTTDGSGELWPREHRRMSVVFQPMGPGCLETQLSCHPVLQTGLRGRIASTSITAMCCETYLTAVPSKLFLKKVVRDFKHTRVIEVTNSGDSTINGSFAWEPSDDHNIDDLEVDFYPREFYLKPGDSLEIKVTVTPFTIGEKTFVVKYVTSSSSHDATLLPVSVSCVFPSLRVIDLRTTNSAPLFTKKQHWRLMAINKFNKVLLNLRPKDTPEVYMDLPSYVITSDPLVVELLVKNSCGMSTRLDIRSLVCCNCVPVKRQVSFSISKWYHNCPHKQQVVLEPASVFIEACDRVILKLTISYKTEGEIESQFLLQLTPEDYEDLCCSVKLRVRRTSIPKHMAYIDTMEPREDGILVFNMRPVYIGDVSPYAQGFSLYNNTKFNANFKVDAEGLSGSPFKYLGGKNEISAVSNCNLMFTFLPYGCKMYEAEIIITLNDVSQKMILRGSGVDNSYEAYRESEYFPSEDEINQINPPAMFFSTSHIDIGPLKPKTISKEVFFVNNNSTDIVSFMFFSTKSTEAVNLRVEPVKGLIKPGDCVECHLSISCEQPSCVDNTLACTYASYTQYTACVQALNQYSDDLVANLDHFTISDKGVEDTELIPPKESWPKKEYLTLGVSVNIKEGPVVRGSATLRPAVVTCQTQVPEIQQETKLIITNVLDKLLWNVLSGLFRTTQLKRDRSELHYFQIKDTDLQTETRVPSHITQNVLEEVLHSAIQNLFQLNAAHGCREFRRRLMSQDSANTRINSQYCRRVMH